LFESAYEANVVEGIILRDGFSYFLKGIG
jgi:hypothetical protein